MIDRSWLVHLVLLGRSRVKPSLSMANPQLLCGRSHPQPLKLPQVQWVSEMVSSTPGPYPTVIQLDLALDRQVTVGNNLPLETLQQLGASSRGVARLPTRATPRPAGGLLREGCLHRALPSSHVATGTTDTVMWIIACWLCRAL